MKLFDSLRFRIAALFHRSQMNAEIEDELRSHIQHRADDLERSGLPRGEAERRARIEFGGQVRYKEESREAAGGTFIESLVQDLRFALRLLRKSPGFTAVAVMTLAMAIGANAVVFGVLNALILHPLNVPDAASLYAIQHGNEASSYQSYLDYLDLRDRNHTLDGLAACNGGQAGLDAGENPSRAWLYEVSGNYFDVLGIQPYLGRVFHPSDEHGANSAPYIVLSYGYWHTRFQDDRGVVGRTVQLNKHPFTIVGVTPPEFHGTLVFFYPDFFVPIVNQVRQPGQPVFRARRRPFPGSRSATCTRSEPLTHFAATIYRSRLAFTGRGHCRTLGRRCVVAQPERMAAIFQISHPFTCEPGRKCLCCSFAARSREWIPLWCRPGKTGTSHRPL